MGLAYHLGRQLVVSHTSAREDGQLLATNQGRRAVDGGHAGVDAAAGVLAADGVDGGAVDVAPLVGVQLAQAVNGAARAVKDTAQHLLGQGNVHGLSGEVGGGVLQRDATGTLKHLEHRPVALDENDTAIAAGAVGHHQLGHLVVRHAGDPFQGHQGAVQVR